MGSWGPHEAILCLLVLIACYIASANYYQRQFVVLLKKDYKVQVSLFSNMVSLCLVGSFFCTYSPRVTHWVHWFLTWSVLIYRWGVLSDHLKTLPHQKLREQDQCRRLVDLVLPVWSIQAMTYLVSHLFYWSGNNVIIFISWNLRLATVGYKTHWNGFQPFNALTDSFLLTCNRALPRLKFLPKQY